MTTNILQVTGVPIVWASGGVGDYEISLGGIATTAARQGAKGYFGDPMARAYSVEFAMDTATAPTVNTAYNLYMGLSSQSGLADGNPGGLLGIDSAYTGIATAEISESVSQLDHIGSLVVVDVANKVQRSHFVYSPSLPYGCPVVVNDTNQTSGKDAAARIKFIPIIDQAQA